MSIWFTSDLHVGHANIIKYCDRPFADVDEMNIALVERWNNLVSPRDIVYILGDLAMGKLDDSLAVVEMLRGSKVLVIGNHDRPFGASPGRRERMERKYIEAGGLAGILHGTVPLQIGGHDVLASHFPYQDDGDQRYKDHRPIDEGHKWLLHGHVHERWKVRAEQRMINVGVDVWDFAPVHEDELVAIIRG